MRTLRLVTGMVLLTTGCGSASSYVRSDTTLGRVVIYRNGMAYFERDAEVEEDQLKLRVPGDKVDDFLKSLSVVDARTNLPAPISYQSPSGYQSSALVDMKISLQGPRPHKIKLSYVTEAPAWKPSYRIKLGTGGKLELQAWAVVDNTSGEDWNQVKLGVGSSSAMSFRFDLRSVRTVQRATLQANDLFAQAPPGGAAAYGGPAPRDERAVVMGDFSDDVIAKADKESPTSEPAPVAQSTRQPKPAARQFDYGAPSAAGGAKGYMAPGRPMPSPTSGPMNYAPPPPPDPLRGLADRLKSSQQSVTIEGYAVPGEPDPRGASLARANKLRDQLLRQGVSPGQVSAVGNGLHAGRVGGVRVVEQAPEKSKSVTPGKDNPAPSMGDPIGTSHFESRTSMSLPRGSSAMVSILTETADGEVVYYYDRESPRGNATYPFRAVRMRNPTGSTLEPGPVTVYSGAGSVGEGMCEPIPARSIAFVPFALDRQVVVETKDNRQDAIERIISAQRGVFTTEVRHTKKTTYTLFNRSPTEKATVYLRHTVGAGFALSDKNPSYERIGGSDLFRVEVPAGGKRDVEVVESTPLYKSVDLRSKDGMDLVRVFLSNAAVEGVLKDKMAALVKLQQDIANVEQRIATVRDQMVEYRQRMDELHAQIVTLRAVKTAGPLMHDLERKLQEMSDKVSKSTIEVVSLQEKLMVTRIKFQDGVSELSLEKKPDPVK